MAKRARSGGVRPLGIRQRIAAANERERANMDASVLCTLLLNMFAWGELSAQQCQKIADASWKDAQAYKGEEAHLDDLLCVAKIGSFGRYANKCYADLMSTLPRRVKVPEPFVPKLPTTFGFLNQAMLLPHELFSCLYNEYQSIWKQFVCPSVEKVEEFWKTNVYHPAMSAAASFTTRPGWPGKFVPLSFHGDDVPVVGVGKVWSQAMTTFSWCSLVGIGDTKDCQYFIYGMFERLRVKNHANVEEDTLWSFFRVLTWSFRALAHGAWPKADHTGRKQLEEIKL